MFYKERWIKENDLEQRLIVTYSIKYRNYQRSIREQQMNGALKAIENNASKLKKVSANDYKRFIKQTHCTLNGEIAEKSSFTIDPKAIEKEAIYDGLHGVCTNLEGDISEIIDVNKRRWKIEECFRIMKNEFKARSVYLSRDDRIKAHFLTRFLASMHLTSLLPISPTPLNTLAGYSSPSKTMYPNSLNLNM